MLLWWVVSLTFFSRCIKTPFRTLGSLLGTKVSFVCLFVCCCGANESSCPSITLEHSCLITSSTILRSHSGTGRLYEDFFLWQTIFQSLSIECLWVLCYLFCIKYLFNYLFCRNDSFYYILPTSVYSQFNSYAWLKLPLKWTETLLFSNPC